MTVAGALYVTVCVGIGILGAAWIIKDFIQGRNDA